jgi:acyl dehydratase
MGRAALPAEIGERFTLTVRLREDEIPAFAASVHDFNPLHHDANYARAAGYPGLIACGPHLGGIFMGMTATHFARPSAGGTRRSGLGLGFELRFRAPVYPDEAIELRWTVTAVERKERLRGWITRLEGDARSARAVLIEGTGALLLRLDDHAAQ